MSDRHGRILVVDDEPLNLDLLRRTLQREFEVVTASGGAEAIAHLETSDVAVVLCDQMMPGKNGTELAAEVRARWPAVKFVLVTGVDEADDVVAAQKSGVVDEIIAKPWNGAKIRERLRALASGG